MWSSIWVMAIMFIQMWVRVLYHIAWIPLAISSWIRFWWMILLSCISFGYKICELIDLLLIVLVFSVQICSYERTGIMEALLGV
jgi:hypothetical protein